MDGMERERVSRWRIRQLENIHHERIEMPTSKQHEVKRKHKKRREKIRAKRQEEMANAKKSTMRQLALAGQLPKHLEKNL